MTKEEIEQAAKEYAECFRYKTETSGWFEQKMEDFIAGFNFALQSENERLKAERGWVSVETQLPEIDEAVEVVTEYLMSGKLCSHRFIGYMNEYGELYSLPEGDSYGWQFNDCVTMWRYLS